MAVVLAIGLRVGRADGPIASTTWLAAAGAGFLVANMGGFSLFVPGAGQTFWAVVALMVAMGGRGSAKAARSTSRSRATVAQPSACRPARGALSTWVPHHGSPAL